MTNVFQAKGANQQLTVAGVSLPPQPFWGYTKDSIENPVILEIRCLFPKPAAKLEVRHLLNGIFVRVKGAIGAECCKVVAMHHHTEISCGVIKKQHGDASPC